MEPAEFSMVRFDAAEIAEIVERIAAEIGLPADLAIEVHIDETTPLGRARLASLDPAVIEVESGAFEDAKRPRELRPWAVADVAGRLLLRLRDRLDPAFVAAGEPPADAALTLAQATAWDAYAMGRLERLGHPSQRDRRHYHFRVRHGFTDVADQAFDHLWSADRLTWAEIDALCGETAAARETNAGLPAM